MHSLQLLETIKVEDGQIFNLPYHQQRCDKSRLILFGSKETLNLASFIDPPVQGLYRCKIVYDRAIISIDYIPYTPKKIRNLIIVPSGIEYAHKYANRDALNKLLDEQEDADEIIIEKEGLLTDTTIANLAFFDGKIWYTPKKPLLEGTIRAKLLKEGFLQTRDIAKENIKHFKNFALMNAMIGFKVLKDFTIQTQKEPL